jgi:hypothetical protein
MNKSYIAGLYDGDGSINMSLVGPENKQGVLLKVELSQNNLSILEDINKELGNNGKIYQDKRVEKYITDTNYCLRFCGKDAFDILNIIQDYGIIKSPQATIALEHLKLDYYDKEQKIINMNMMKMMNSDKTDYDKPYGNINDGYISGLFDAEGNVYFTTNSKGKKKSYVKITQTGCPEILEKISEYLGFGSTSEVGRWRIYSKVNYKKFHAAICDTSIMKIDKLNKLLDFVS